MNRDIEAFINAVVQDQPKARLMLSEDPGLLNARYIHNETVLHFMAVENFSDGVKFLAKAGAEIDAVNEFGDTALVDAAVLGNVEVVKILLRHRADPNASSVTRDNVVHAAAMSGSPEVLDAILAAGARSDYVTDINQTIWDAIAVKPDRRTKMEAVLTKHGVSR